MTAPLPYTNPGRCRDCGEAKRLGWAGCCRDCWDERARLAAEWDDRDTPCVECDGLGVVRDITARTVDGAVAEVGPSRACRSCCAAEPTC